MSSVYLPASPIYDLIPDQAMAPKKLLYRSIELSNEGRIRTGRVYAACAVGVLLVDTAGFALRAGMRIVTAIIYVEFNNLRTLVLEDLSDACKSLYVGAALTCFIFGTIFFPDKLSFKKELPQINIIPPPPFSLSSHHVTHISSEEMVRLPMTDGSLYLPAAAVSIAASSEATKEVVMGLMEQFPFPESVEIVQAPALSFAAIVEPKAVKTSAAIVETPVAPLAVVEPTAVKTSAAIAETPVAPLAVVEPTAVQAEPIAPKEAVPHVVVLGEESEAEEEEPASPTNDIQQILRDIPKSKTIFGQFRATMDTWFFSHHHPAKDQKYREFFVRLVANYEGNLEKELKEVEKFGPIGVDTAKVLQEILQPENAIDAREQYQKFIHDLRDTLVKLKAQTPTAESKRCLEILSKISYARFVKTELYSYCKHLIEIANGKPLPDNLTFANFVSELEKVNKACEKMPHEISISSADRVTQKLKGALNVSFDALAGSNLPYARASFAFRRGEEVAKVTELRHGVPVSQTDLKGIPLRTFETGLHSLASLTNGYLNRGLNYVAGVFEAFRVQMPSAVINPDYEAFLDEAEKRGENVLHVILESGEMHILGDESERVTQRMNLQHKHSNYFPIALPKDGAFYNREGDFAKITTFKDLQKVLIEQMYDKNSPFRLPEKLLKDEAFRKNLPTLFHKVRHLFFKDGHITSLEDHQGFILLCYAFLVLDLQPRLKINIFEMICKDDIDRANAFKTIFELLILKMMDKENDSELLQTVLVNTVAPPVIVKKQTIIPKRAKAIGIVMNILNKMTPRQNILLKKKTDFDGWKPDSYGVFPVEDQGVYPMGSTAGTQKEYQTFLNFFSNNVRELPPRPYNMVDNIAKGKAFHDENGLCRQKILDQITKDLPRIKYYIGKKKMQKAEEIEAFLLSKGLSHAEVLKTLCSCQQGLSSDIFGELVKKFNNPSLGYLISQDSHDPTFEQELRVDVDKKGIVNVQMIFLSRLLDQKLNTVVKYGASTYIDNVLTGTHKFSILVKP